jgi:hypothetical protein
MSMLEFDERQRLPAKVEVPSAVVSHPAHHFHRSGIFKWLLFMVSLQGCESTTVIAAFSCPKSSNSSLIDAAGAAAGAGNADSTFTLPWSSGFENGWCDYRDGKGFFAESGTKIKEVVTSPVHSGTFAAKFTVDSGDDGQMRAVRSGPMPVEAFYGVWYYVPALAKNTGLWNLIHFQGDNSSVNQGHLWDISLVNNDSGDLRLEVFSYWITDGPNQSKNPPIPIGKWFHIEMFWKRATDETGEVIVYQDGKSVYEMTNIKTDNTSSTSSVVNWYVGNLATDLEPIESTVYVDDVSIKTTH